MAMDVEKVEVGPRGPIDSTFVIVGEAPGRQEIIQRAPFVGPSGLVLDTALKQFPKDSYPEPYITNTYRSLIPSQQKDPKMLERLAMEQRPRLLEELNSRPTKPRIILALGNVALHALTGNTALRITKARGSLYPSELAEVGIFAATHPAFLLRGGGSFRQFKADVANTVMIAQGGAPRPWKEPTWSILRTPEEVAEVIVRMGSLPDGTQVAHDVETTGFSHRMDRILCGGFTWDGDHVYCYIGHKTDALAKGIGQNVLDALRPIWDLRNIRNSWHNGKFDVKFFGTLGQPAVVDDDSMLMSYALEEVGGIHDLETVAGDWLNSPNWKGVLDKYIPNKKTSYDAIPWEVLVKYMAFDIANTWRLKPVLMPLIENDKASSRLYHKTLIPASAYLAEVEKNGLFVDPIRVKANFDAKYIEAEGYKSELLKAAHEVSPGEFTDKMCNSPKQLSTLIYDRLGLKEPKGAERSTADDVLDKLPAVPIVVTLRMYRKVHKALSTYVTPYHKRWDEDGSVEDDGRVHTTYLLHGTATGRLASRNPNLQNIPRDPVIKGQFIAPSGRMFTEVDLNQAELRSLAQLSGDPVLLNAYLNPDGGGLHEVTRAGMYGVKADWTESQIQGWKAKWFIPDQDPDGKMDPRTFLIKRILAEQKMKAKNVNFGIIYGITSSGLSEQTGEPPNEAQRWLDAWAKLYPVAWDFIQQCRMAPLRGQNLVTVFGHKKRFQIVTPETKIAQQNEAANMPHQSTASTITLHGGIRTWQWLKERDAMFANTVHDSLLVEHPEDPHLAYAIQRKLRETLEQVPRDWGLTKLPFQADAEMFHRYGSKGDPVDFFAEQGWDWEATEAAYEAQLAA